MAFLYTLDINTFKLKHYTSNGEGDIKVLDKLHISHRTSLTKYQIEDLSKEYPFSDTYNTRGFNIYSDIHRHDDKEARLIIKGEGLFYIPLDQELLVVQSYAGDLIKIEPNIDHWFSTSGELMAIRFFSDEHGHVSLKPSPSRMAIKAHHHFEKGFNISF